jgi:ABC-type nitrate/sulfonate/bicarbonate transport system permease component
MTTRAWHHRSTARRDPAVWRWRVAVAATLVAGWEILGRSAGTLLLPSASATAVALARLLVSTALWRALASSHAALLVGFAAAAVLGAPLGLVLGRRPAAARALAVQLDALMVTPMSAVIPLVILAAGLSLWTRAFVVFAFAAPVIVVTVEAGARDVDPRLIEMARAFGASPRQIARRVILPAARPALLTALRLGLGRAFSGMVVSELVLMAAGIGGLILRFQADFDAASVYAVVVIVVGEAVVIMKTASRLERRLAPWRPTGVVA